MSKETIYLTISATASKTVSWDKTLIDSYSIEVERQDAYKAVAQEIMKLDPSNYSKGLYVRAVNNDGDVESYLLVNTNENGKESFFVRQGNAHWGGWDSSYLDLSEKKKYLVCLDEETNDYKSYSMYQEEYDDDFYVKYGRIGGADIDTVAYNFSKEGGQHYPAKMFWIKYYEKLNKGYMDKSEIKDFERSGYNQSAAKTKPTELADFKPIEEKETKDLIEFLISRQREYVQQNYKYEDAFSTEFNQKAIDIADDLLNQMNIVMQTMDVYVAKGEKDVAQNKVISLYKELMLTLPRKVNNVSEYIHRIDFDNESSDNYVFKILENERDLLENLKDICMADGIIEEKEENESKETVLERYGLSAQTADFKDKFKVLEKMGDDAYRVSKVTAVCNKRTDEAYKACKQELGIHDGGCHLFWHGSRTENWWSIFKNGMSLNPNAVVTGKMFGQGLYFAPLARKSLGYVDMYGSYWAHGSQKTGYLALFEVAMGKPYEVDHAISSSFSYRDLRYGCHSVWAKAGRHLYNDECIVYREDQCNIKYLVEVDYDRSRQYSIDIKKVQNLRFTNLEFEDDCLVANVPNFKTCTGIPSRGVTICYDLINDTMFFSNSTISSVLNETDKEFIEDVFKSKLADNSREFSKLCKTIISEGEIPAAAMRRIKKECRANDKER